MTILADLTIDASEFESAAEILLDHFEFSDIETDAAASAISDAVEEMILEMLGDPIYLLAKNPAIQSRLAALPSTQAADETQPLAA